jgi:hypothetical protein
MLLFYVHSLSLWVTILLFLTPVGLSWVSAYFYTVMLADWNIHRKVTVFTVFHNSLDIEVNGDPLRFRRNYFPERPAPVEFCTSRNCIHTWSNVYVDATESSLNPNSKNSGTWSTTAWPPCRPCYRPAVFFHYLHFIALFSRKEKFGTFRKCYYFFLNFLKSLRKSEISLSLRAPVSNTGGSKNNINLFFVLKLTAMRFL